MGDPKADTYQIRAVAGTMEIGRTNRRRVGDGHLLWLSVAAALE
jgi:hypothetical protein